MPSREDTSYFGAGPAPLPTAVLTLAAKYLLDYNNNGIGLCEISHRSADAQAILAATKSSLKLLLNIPDNFEVLFLQSGGTGEFSASAYNLVSVWVQKRKLKAEKELTAAGVSEQDLEAEVLKRLKKEVDSELILDYLVTGSWSNKAAQEGARLYGKDKVNVATDGRLANNGKFLTIPEESSWKLSGARGEKAALVYYCDNETVDGVEFPAFPSILAPNAENPEDGPIVVADMSSNFLSRPIEFSNYALVFGGAQKNIGSTGIALVIARKDILDAKNHASADLLRKLNLPIGPIVLDYPIIAKNDSLYNTLPIFDVWIAGEVIKGLLSTHGDLKIQGQENLSGEKAKILYGVLDGHDAYHVVPDKSIRSRMNICFRVKGGDADAEKTFLKGAEERGLTGLKGHRSVGGIRISNCES